MNPPRPDDTIDGDGAQMLAAFMGAHAVTTLTGGTSHDMARTALQALPRAEVQRIRDVSATMLAAANEVLEAKQ